MSAATGLGWLKLSPRSIEWVAVMPGASVRLVSARFGTPEKGKFTAMSASPPPSAMLSRLQKAAKMPQPSGRPSYLKG
jgi:hypothetical protein